MNVFDKIAHHYDSPKQLELANSITNEIKTHVGDTSNKLVLDYGCGTGLIGLQIVNDVKEMYFVDPSQEMIHIVDQKIAEMNQTNVKTVIGRFSKNHTLNIKADLIIVSLVLLHVPDTLDLLESLYQALNLGGQLIIIDFDKNEKIYHEKVHNGFVQEELKKQMAEIGFNSVSSQTFHHGKNLFMKQDASMFSLIAEK